jgi:hypothetical protein
MEGVILIGAYRFPGNVALTELEGAARAEATRQDTVDTIRFGRWRDWIDHADNLGTRTQALRAISHLLPTYGGRASATGRGGR